MSNDQRRHQFLSYDQARKHNPYEKRGGGDYLQGWKQRGYVDIVLHRACMPAPLWYHPFTRVDSVEDKTTGTFQRKLRWTRLNCFEPESVLSERYFRDRTTAVRQRPPTACPKCKFDEWLFQQIRANRLDPLAPVFDFEGYDSKGQPRRVVYRAGGMCGMFKADKWLSEDQKARVKTAGVVASNAYKETTEPKLDYVFAVVSYEEIAKGVIIARETGALGTATLSLIDKLMTGRGVERGDPSKNPYVIRWQYHKDRLPQQKYDALEMEQLMVTPDIMALISGDAPDIERACRPFDVASERARWETHCLLKGVPWDDFFKGHDTTTRNEQATDFPFGANAPTAAAAAPTPVEHRPRFAPAGQIVPGYDYECDVCHVSFAQPMSQCSQCGASYDAEGNLRKDVPQPNYPPATRWESNAVPAAGAPTLQQQIPQMAGPPANAPGWNLSGTSQPDDEGEEGWEPEWSG